MQINGFTSSPRSVPSVAGTLHPRLQCSLLLYPLARVCPVTVTVPAATAKPGSALVGHEHTRLEDGRADPRAAVPPPAATAAKATAR
jgi:hypothetical protein